LRPTLELFATYQSTLVDDLPIDVLPPHIRPKPGLLLNRQNYEKIAEKIIGQIPFFPKIESGDVEGASRIEAELQAKILNDNTAATYHKKDLIKIGKTEVKKLKKIRIFEIEKM